jgi:ATP/maltotriose-dependent transcriptional regulator MalT
MKRTILLYAFLTALLMVAVKLFEVSLFTGEISMRIYITLIGALFLALGIAAGLKLRRRIVEKEIEVRYVEKLVEVVPATAPTATLPESAIPESAIPGSAASDLLSARESEVLRHIARGLTNREVAEQLFVSENTIKTHLNNIYAKLGVRRRTEAIFKAKELKILA